MGGVKDQIMSLLKINPTKDYRKLKHAYETKYMKHMKQKLRMKVERKQVN